MNSPSAQPTLPRTLSRKQLTIALVIVTLVPFLLVIAMWSSLPDEPEPVLPAEVHIRPQAWPNAESENAQLVPCVVLKNPTDGQWDYVNLSINEQFHFTHPDPLPGGEQIAIPLKFFHTKGNQFFPPEQQSLKLLTVFAQIPNGARAVKEFALNRTPDNLLDDDQANQSPAQQGTK